MTDSYDDFLTGGSPYVDYSNIDNAGNTVHGGDIRYGKTPHAKWILIGIVVLICIYILYNIYNDWNNGSPQTYTRKRARIHFNNLHGETFDDDAKQAIKFGEAIEEPRAMDHYRMGTVYLVNANDPHRAHNHFRQALEQVIDGVVDVRDTPFLLDRIDDYKDDFLDFPDIEELPLQAAMLAHFNMAQQTIHEVKQKKPDISEDDPDFTQKLLLSRQKWNSDSQNVHDSTITYTMKEQYKAVTAENLRIPNIGRKDYTDMCNWLKAHYSNNVESRYKVDKVLEVLNNNYPIGSMNGLPEQAFVETLWKRAHDPRNANKTEDIKRSLGDAMLDCVEGGHVVCMAGRTAKMWQTLAHVDFDPRMGIIKNKQAIRNEVYERSAKIVDDIVGTNGSASSSLKEAYNNSENTEQVQEVVESIRKQIDDLYNVYSDRLPDAQLKLLLEECKAVV